MSAPRIIAHTTTRAKTSNQATVPESRRSVRDDQPDDEIHFAQVILAEVRADFCLHSIRGSGNAR